MRERELSEVTVGGIAIAEDALHLGSEAPVDVRILVQEVPGPDQRVRRGLVPSEQRRDDLVQLSPSMRNQSVAEQDRGALEQSPLVVVATVVSDQPRRPLLAGRVAVTQGYG